MYDECNMWNVGACTYFVDVISFLSMMFICLCREQPPKLIVIKKKPSILSNPKSIKKHHFSWLKIQIL